MAEARQPKHVLLRGGLDLISSPLTVDGGRLWGGLNYEPVEAGYRRIIGYERFDGRPKPSEAEYWMLGYTLEAADTRASVGDTLIGANNATAVVLAVTDDDYVLGELDGTIAEDEAVNVSGTAAGTASSTPRRLGAATIEFDFEYRDLAATHRRTNIMALPGSGVVRGVWVYKGSTYAFRDNAGATAGGMYKATAAGWTAVDLGRRIGFDAGTVEPTVGLTLTGATSGATAQLGAVVLSDSLTSLTTAWATGVAEGTFWLTAVTGTFQDNEGLQQSIGGTATTVAMANGAAIANTLPAGGRYDFRNYNFFAQINTREMFGVNGAGPAFHYNGIQFVSITTAQPDDRPTHLAVHAFHLLLTYRGGSIVVSETGNPDGYSALRGTAELGSGQELYDAVHVAAGNTIFTGSDHIDVLYGSDSGDFALRDHSDPQTGGVEWTAQNVGGPIYMDNRGVRSVTTTEKYGNFVVGTMTADIQTWINIQREQRNIPTASMRVRSSDQYRLFFESGIGLVLYVGRGTPELSFIDYGVKVRCAVSAEDEDRIERVYFGSDDGWVFQAESGRSFDGEEIEAFARLPLNHMGRPSHDKTFFEAYLELDIKSRVSLGISAIFDDGRSPEHLESEQELYGGGGIWDESLWDEFYWDSPLNGFGEFDLTGSGRNVSILVRSKTKVEAPHILNGLSIHYSVDGLRDSVGG